MINFFIKCYTEKYFKFFGRASRKEYISYILFYALLTIFLNAIYFYFESEYVLYISAFAHIASFFPQICLGFRRFHDINLSGFFVLAIAPIIFLIKSEQYSYIGIALGLLYCFLLLISKGTPGPNKYGPPPND